MDKLLQNENGVKMLSLIWGLGLSCLFRKVCKDRNCIVLKAPTPKMIDGKVYQYDGTCYQFTPYNSKCSADALNV